MSDLKIERVGERGDGLAQGKAFARTLPGEIVNEITGAVKQPSPDRISPFCPVFDTCGGCKVQHWRLEPYQAWKLALLVEALKAQGIVAQINPMIDAHGQGRRRVTLHVRQVNGAWVAGFMAEKSHALVALEACPILVPKLQTAPQIARAFGAILGNCDVSITAADNGLDVSIKADRKLADKVMGGFEVLMQRHNILRISINGIAAAQVVPPVTQMGKAQVQLPIGSFLQATLQGQETLAALLEPHLKKAKSVVDLFCGVGPFTFSMAEHRKVHGIDSDKPSIALLQHAVRYVTGLKPVTAAVQDLFVNPLVPAELNEYDAIIFDPPRAGADAQCRNIAKSKVKTVIAVSCDVQSFARDAKILIEGGYALKEVTPVDQFKYTPHLEVVAHFRKA
jgi:23S rRNA (uracil1939-C5)-methyltransferase